MLFKQLLKKILPSSLLFKIKLLKLSNQIQQWQDKQYGLPFPISEHAKQLTIEYYQRKYAYSTFIETGTYLGEMVNAQKKNFSKIISIELDKSLHLKAVKRFASYPNIIILQGDSSNVLPEIINDLNEPAIFWLDGHFSNGITAKGDKECPIIEELDAIFKGKNLNHVLLIDDARLFIGKKDYPTLEFLKEYVFSKNPQYSFKVIDDIIRFEILPNS